MTDEQANDFGVYIKGMRIARGWSVRQLATLANIDASVITHLESGKSRKPQVKTLQDLAIAFNVPLVELFKAAGYATSCEAPCIEAHLRLCYSHLPEEKIAQIVAFAEQIISETEHRHQREVSTDNQA